VTDFEKQQAGLGEDSDGLTPTVQFQCPERFEVNPRTGGVFVDIDTVFEMLRMGQETGNKRAAEAIEALFRWIAGDGNGADQFHQTKAIQSRTFAMIWVVCPGLLGGISLRKLAERTGCSKTALGNAALDFCERFNFVSRAMKQSTRERIDAERENSQAEGEPGLDDRAVAR
jgi:hypothetical protein